MSLALPAPTQKPTACPAAAVLAPAWLHLALGTVVHLNALSHLSQKCTKLILVTALLLQPLRVPGFAFAWLELISHRSFMPKLLLAPGHKGWSHFQRLLVALLRFLEPYLRNAELTDAVRLLYKVWLLWGMLYLCCPVLAPQLQLLLPIEPTTCPLLTPTNPCAKKTLSLQCISSFLAPPHMPLHGLPCSLQRLWCG